MRFQVVRTGFHAPPKIETAADPEPSAEDVEVTRRLCAVGELVGIRVLDHVVIGDGRYVSFLERGMIDP